jgi:hypothetical protein
LTSTWKKISLCPIGSALVAFAEHEEFRAKALHWLRSVSTTTTHQVPFSLLEVSWWTPLFSEKRIGFPAWQSIASPHWWCRFGEAAGGYCVEILLRQFLVDVGVAASGWLLCIEATASGSNVATTRWDGFVALYRVGDNLELWVQQACWFVRRVLEGVVVCRGGCLERIVEAMVCG